jgi:hypothetical protein
MQQELRTMARTVQGRGQLLPASLHRMLIGFAWFSGGVFVTWFRQREAESRGGGTALIAWGAILYGLAAVLMGAWRWIRLKASEVA